MACKLQRPMRIRRRSDPGVGTRWSVEPPDESDRDSIMESVICVRRLEIDDEKSPKAKPWGF